jgi:hypothetical protein
MRSAIPFSIAIVAMGVIHVAHADERVRAGKWEITQAMSAPGLPPMPPVTVTQCVTPEQANSPTGVMPQDPNAPKCSPPDTKTSGNTVSWTMSCDGEQKIEISGQMTFGKDSYTGSMNYSSSEPGMPAMSSKISGKRIGDC